MSNQARSFLALLGATFIYGMFGIFMRLLGNDFDAFNQSMVRNALEIPIILFMLWRWPKFWNRLVRESIPWIIGWVLVGVVVIIMVYIAFNAISIGMTYFLFYGGLAISGVFSGMVLFGERMNRVKGGALTASIIGLLLMFGVSIDVSTLYYQGLALVAGLFGGLWYVLSKKISVWYSEIQSLFIDSTGTALVLFLFLLPQGFTLAPIQNYEAWGITLLFAACYVAAAGLAFYGYKHLEAQKASAIMPIEAFWGAFFGWLFFRESLPLQTWLGGGVILAAVIGMHVFSEKPKAES